VRLQEALEVAMLLKDGDQVTGLARIPDSVWSELN